MHLECVVVIFKSLAGFLRVIRVFTSDIIMLHFVTRDQTFANKVYSVCQVVVHMYYVHVQDFIIQYVQNYLNVELLFFWG